LDNAIDIFPKDHQYVTLFHFQELFTQFYSIQKKYRFFFMDILYLIEEYPDIMNQYRLATSKRFEDARSLINYYVDSDRLVPEKERVNYDMIIRTLWMTSTFWSAGTALLDEKNTSLVEDSPLQTLWAVLKPYLTDKGYNEYLEITQNKAQKQIRT
ncbi:MAG: TetR/AcrR family transcriptional regulator, partial [Bacteroidota bacterium]